jgi:energy-coupling factor transporter ATP-binding protein EcfA2
MPDIFISHSSLDNRQALDLAAELRDRGFQSVFLDFDPESGIPAGLEWESVLFEKLKRSRALIVLHSENWRRSRWCFAELSLARVLGRTVIPVRLDNTPLDPSLSKVQSISSLAVATQRIVNGLLAAGIDFNRRRVPDPDRPPFPGLASFQPEDAAVFFGRDDEIRRIIDRLALLRLTMDRKFVLLTGPSGSGKSSLLLAGILPGLRSQTETWYVCSPIRAGSYRPGMLSAALADAGLTGGSRTHVVPIDQLEEALADNNEMAKSSLLHELCELLKGAEHRVLAIATIRSDAMGQLESSAELTGLGLEFLRVDTVDKSGLKAVILEPCELCGIRVEDGLAERIVEDCADWKALPALAYTLREMYERTQPPRYFSHSLYSTLGGVSGILNERIRALIEISRLTPEQVRSAVFQLVWITPSGEFQRRPVPRSRFAGASGNLIDQMVAARVLVSDTVEGIATVELAHESLLRNWGTLAGWLERYRDFFSWRNRFDALLARFKRSGAVLEADEIAEAERWSKEGLANLGSDGLALLDASRQRGRSDALARRAWTALRIGGGSAALWWLAGKAVYAWLAAYQGPPPRMVAMAPEGAALVGTQRALPPEYAVGVLLAVFSPGGFIAGLIAFGRRVAAGISGLVIFLVLLLSSAAIDLNAPVGQVFRPLPFALAGSLVLILCVRASGRAVSQKWAAISALFLVGLWIYKRLTADSSYAAPPDLDLWTAVLYSWLAMPAQVPEVLRGSGLTACAELLLASGTVVALASAKGDAGKSLRQFVAWRTGAMACAAVLLVGLMLSLAPLANREARRAQALGEISWVSSELPHLQQAYKTRKGRYAISMKEINATAWDWARESVRYCQMKGQEEKEAEKRGAPPSYDLSLIRKLSEESALGYFLLSQSDGRNNFGLYRFDTSRVEFVPGIAGGWAATIQATMEADVRCTAWDGNITVPGAQRRYFSGSNHLKCDKVLAPIIPNYGYQIERKSIDCNDVLSIQLVFPQALGHPAF